ncbi:MarR family transcriptional regulator [Ensifer adhaerens]|uniref:MarR family transcriptional regulator n=1 Tax=Ensifer adhaerens TaxID=106592 RepID=A0A0L8BFP0_ENSAD|nr:MarR family transcriptional regulator [Ensifer adhaerens]KOF13449.1 MarR family transcriptional regulator [Ensifer adhaerens]
MPTSPTAKGLDAPQSSSSQTENGGRKLSNFLCFAIYSANLAFGRAYKPILDKLGLTYTQYVAMVALSEEDDQTVGTLGEKLFLESNTLTPILKKLESEGYLQRRRDPADERQVRVTLTPAGRKLVEMDPGAALTDAIGLGDEFPVVQQTVAQLRDNLLRATQAGSEKV